MASFFPLSGITGCTNSTGITTAYDIKYNSDLISSYYKKDLKENFIEIYLVVCIVGTHVQQFIFSSSTDRDTFYNSLP